MDIESSLRPVSLKGRNGIVAEEGVGHDLCAGQSRRYGVLLTVKKLKWNKG